MYPQKSRKSKITIELALKILKKDSSLTDAERNMNFDCGTYNYSAHNGSVVDTSSMKMVDGVGAISRTDLVQTQDIEANRQALISQLESALEKQNSKSPQI